MLIVPVQWEGNEIHLVFDDKTVRLRAGPDAETNKWIKTLEQWKKATKMKPPPLPEKGAKPPKPKGKPRKTGVHEGESGDGDAVDGEEGAPAVASLEDEEKEKEKEKEKVGEEGAAKAATEEGH